MRSPTLITLIVLPSVSLTRCPRCIPRRARRATKKPRLATRTPCPARRRARRRRARTRGARTPHRAPHCCNTEAASASCPLRVSRQTGIETTVGTVRRRQKTRVFVYARVSRTTEKQNPSVSVFPFRSRPSSEAFAKIKLVRESRLFSNFIDILVRHGTRGAERKAGRRHTTTRGEREREKKTVFLTTTTHPARRAAVAPAT